MGIAGMATTVILAVKATPKALDIMEDKKADMGVTYLTRKEIAQATWKLYAPSIGIGLAYLNRDTLKNAFNDFKEIIVKTIQAVID